MIGSLQGIELGTGMCNSQVYRIVCRHEITVTRATETPEETRKGMEQRRQNTTNTRDTETLADLKALLYIHIYL